MPGRLASASLRRLMSKLCCALQLREWSSVRLEIEIEELFLAFGTSQVLHLIQQDLRTGECAVRIAHVSTSNTSAPRVHQMGAHRLGLKSLRNCQCECCPALIVLSGDVIKFAATTRRYNEQCRLQVLLWRGRTQKKSSGGLPESQQGHFFCQNTVSLSQ